MTCDIARDALLGADLPLADADGSELGLHLGECHRCATLAAALTRDVATLSSAVHRRTIRRRRVVGAAVASTAAAVVLLFAARGHRDEQSSAVAATPVSAAAVNVRKAGVVSVQVAPGKQATVFKTRDPTVTVVWLSDGGGL